MKVPIETEADILKRELDEMALYLKTIKGETRDLLGKDYEEPKKIVTKILSEDQKRQKSHSSWARSKVPSTLQVHKKPEEDFLSNLEIDKAESKIKTKSPAYSMGGRRHQKELIINGDIPGPADYQVDERALSVRKRPRSAHICPQTPKQTINQDKQNRQSTPRMKSDNIEDGYESGEWIEIVEYERVIPRAVKFGTANRFPDSQKKRNSNNLEDEGIIIDYANVEKAAKAIEPHIPGAIMIKPTTEPRIIPIQTPPTTPSSVITSSALDVLSTRHRSPGVTFHKNNPINKQQLLKEADLGMPGPGFYSVDDNIIGTKKCKLYHQPTGLKPKAQDVTQSQKKKAQILGPGYYNPVNVSSQATNIPKLYPSESKITPHLERKKYFEQKAQDMREANDQMKLIDDSILRKRTPVHSIQSEKATHKKINPKIEQIKLLNDIDELIGYQTKDYQVKYDLIEKRSTTPVNMKREFDARIATKEKIQSKPQVLKILNEKNDWKPSMKKFYGPQLHVEWVKDKESMMVKTSQLGLDEEDFDEDGPESPTADILRWFNDSKTPKGQDEQALTEAYLRSSYAGSIYHKKGIPMSSEPTKPKVVFDEEEGKNEQDFIGPQLQVDWTKDPMVRFKSAGVNMDNYTSRDKIKVLQKGVIDIQKFSDHHIKQTDPLGPGVYDTFQEIGKVPAKGVVDFSKQVAREDHVGPNGEKPISAQAMLEDEYIMEEKLDIEYGDAKDRYLGKDKKKGIELYAKVNKTFTFLI